MSISFLVHHGIKGQKWGTRNGPPYPLSYAKKSSAEKRAAKKSVVRKYQNVDGTLTLEGMKLYKSILDDTKDTRYYSNGYYFSVEDGRVVNDGKELEKLADKINTTGVIPEGTVFYRQSSEPEGFDDSRKYVTVSQGASSEYSNPDMLIGGGVDPHSYAFVAKRDLKIATDRDVEDYIFSQYPNAEYLKALRDGRNYINKTMGNNSNVDISAIKVNSPEMDLALSYSGKVSNTLHYYLADLWGATEDTPDLHAMYKTSNKIQQHFEKLGYDAISDVEDGGLTNGDLYAMILLHPKKDTTLVEDLDYIQYMNNRYAFKTQQQY